MSGEELRDAIARWLGQSGYVRAESHGGDMDRAWRRMQSEANGLLEFLREQGAALAAPSTPEPSGLREALNDLLWWSEHMQREDRDHIDLADTDEEAERRWQLMQTLGDHERRAAWLRAVIGLPSAAGSSGSGSTSGSAIPSGSLSPASDGRAAPSTPEPSGPDTAAGTTFCPCGAAWIGTRAQGMAEQRSHAEFHASGGPGLGAPHDPGLATFVPDRAAPSTEPALDATRLAHAYNNAIVLTGEGHGMSMRLWAEVAAEYARLAESQP